MDYALINFILWGVIFPGYLLYKWNNFCTSLNPHNFISIKGDKDSNK